MTRFSWVQRLDAEGMRRQLEARSLTGAVKDSTVQGRTSHEQLASQEDGASKEPRSRVEKPDAGHEGV